MSSSLDYPPEMKVGALAQWIIESGRGSSRLAKDHFNFGGLKWRKEMEGFAQAVVYKASDGEDFYCKFGSPADFVRGYLQFIKRSPYRGFEEHTGSARGYVSFLFSRGYATDPNYLTKVFRAIPEARELLGIPAPTPEVDYKRPKAYFYRSGKYSSRRGAKVSKIVMHYTAGSTIESARITLTKPVSEGGREASAHYCIGRDGRLEQYVQEKDKAWHASKVNSISIGIEHVALPDQALTAQQEQTSIALVKYLLHKYGLPHTAITGHKWTGTPTACPDNLFGPKGTYSELVAWRTKHFANEFP